jgi:hypothetical protein
MRAGAARMDATRRSRRSAEVASIASRRETALVVSLGLTLALATAGALDPGSARGTPTPSSAGFRVALGGPTSLALGSSAEFWANTSGGSGPMNYAWTVNGTAPTAGDRPDLTYRPLADGVDRIAVEVRDAAGSVANATLSLVVLGPSPVSVRVIFGGSDSAGGATLRAVAAGGTPPYSYRWAGLGAPAGWTGIANWTTPPLPAGRFVYTVSVVDRIGYRAASNLTIQSAPRTLAQNGLGFVPIAIGGGAAAGTATGTLLAVNRRRRRALR